MPQSVGYTAMRTIWVAGTGRKRLLSCLQDVFTQQLNTVTQVGWAKYNEAQHIEFGGLGCANPTYVLDFPTPYLENKVRIRGIF